MIKFYENRVLESLNSEKLTALPTLDPKSPPSVYIGPALDPGTLQSLIKQGTSSLPSVVPPLIDSSPLYPIGMKSIINLQAPTETTFHAEDEKLMNVFLPLSLFQMPFHALFVQILNYVFYLHCIV